MLSNVPQPVWVMKTAREKRMHRLVHMSADMAREVGIILEDSRHGIYVEVSFVLDLPFMFSFPFQFYINRCYFISSRFMGMYSSPFRYGCSCLWVNYFLVMLLNKALIVPFLFR